MSSQYNNTPSNKPYNKNYNNNDGYHKKNPNHQKKNPNHQKKDPLFIQKNLEYYVKFIECEKNADWWHSCGQYKMANDERRRAKCLSEGNIKGYDAFVPNHENFIITKKFEYLLPENKRKVLDEKQRKNEDDVSENENGWNKNGSNKNVWNKNVWNKQLV